MPVLEAEADVGLVHGHVDVIGADGEVLAAETAHHHELFSAAHRNGVTYAGYAFDCRCFSSAITAARRSGPRRRRLYDTALLLDDYDLYLRLALDSRIVFLEGAPMALYRHHEGQMTTYELTMGQIQTAEKHLALLDGRADVPDARPRAAQLPAHARAQLRGARATSPRRAAICCRRSGSIPGLIRKPWVARRLVASVVRR